MGGSHQWERKEDGDHQMASFLSVYHPYYYDTAMVIMIVVMEKVVDCYQMKRMVCSEDSAFSPFSLFKMEAHDTFDSLWILTSLADFFFIYWVSSLIVMFF
jgi:hypothetical protein